MGDGSRVFGVGEPAKANGDGVIEPWPGAKTLEELVLDFRRHCRIMLTANLQSKQNASLQATHLLIPVIDVALRTAHIGEETTTFSPSSATDKAPETFA